MHSEPTVSPRDTERHRAARARVGSLLADRWHVDELLGVGGMAAVYSATHRNGRRVALKVLHPALAQVEEIRERFLDEAYAANSVGHPGTVAVLDDGKCPDGSHFLVMDLLEGETLEARLGRSVRGLPAREVLALTAPLLEVLSAAHDRGIVHRDIKPENVFLTSSGEVKLLDFGIARRDDSPRQRTQAGLTLGTPSFMAPEQARGRWDELDARTDLWSVGATMFALLTGRNVHEAETQNEALLAAMSQRAPSVASVAPHVPRTTADIVDRALAFAKEDRFDSAEAMLVAVVSAQLELAELEGRPPPVPRAGDEIGSVRFAPLEGETYQGVTVVEGPSGARPRRGPLLAASALVGAALLGTGVRVYGAAAPEERAERPRGEDAEVTETAERGTSAASRPAEDARQSVPRTAPRTLVSHADPTQLQCDAATAELCDAAAPDGPLRDVLGGNTTPVDETARRPAAAPQPPRRPLPRRPWTDPLARRR
jgi:serine/threonine-protein kinase